MARGKAIAMTCPGPPPARPPFRPCHPVPFRFPLAPCERLSFWPWRPPSSVGPARSPGIAPTRRSSSRRSKETPPPRDSDGKTYTTTRFGDGAITRGQGQQVTTRRFGAGTISRSSDGTTTTSQRFGSGTINRSSSGAGTTISKFGNGYLTRANGSARAKDQTGVMVLPAPSARQTNKLPDQTTSR
jgi:hypothetical protein